MARGHSDLPPRAAPVIIDKQDLFAALRRIDRDEAARGRIMAMETGFRQKMDSHISALLLATAPFVRFNTNPFVLLLYARRKAYSRVGDIEKDIAPAKLFSSMETAAGRIVEDVTLPVFGWNAVASQMHSTRSIIDGECFSADRSIYDAATLKSGPRCLNDEMAKDLGSDIADNLTDWALRARARHIRFTYGVLYGTKKLSNKKDWHVIRNFAQKLPRHARVISSHAGNWGTTVELSTIEVSATVRIGRDWWTHLGGNEWTFLEVCAAMIRACIVPTELSLSKGDYVIRDLARIIDISSLATGFNVGILQQSQFEWLLFMARHFCDGFTDETGGGGSDGTGARSKGRRKLTPG